MRPDSTRSTARLVALVVSLCLGAATAQNSTRKLRGQPSSIAALAGSAAPWLESLEEALVLARQAGKPVFWYVPTVAGSPMDRKPEIDRYMLAGPFSWPSTVELLRDHFVPVRLAASGEQVEAYGLRRGAFIEPGWLVLSKDGDELQRMQQLTTFQPEWFEAPLRRLAGLPPIGFQCGAAVRDAWDAYRRRDLDGCLRALDALLAERPGAAVTTEALFLRGCALRRSNRNEAADLAWAELVDGHPGSPWAGKAAMERQGFGPFVRGFEDYLPVPPRALTELGLGSRSIRGAYQVDELWQVGTSFLLRLADADGILRDSIYDFGGTDSLPNVYLAISFLAGEALLRACARHDAGGFQLLPGDRDRAERRLTDLRAAADEGPFALADRDEILWAQAYRLRFLSRWLELRPDDGAGLAPLLQRAAAAVVDLQPDSGVWFHEYGNPFAIATALLALHDARLRGAEVAPGVIERGVRALARCRAENGAFTYADPGRRGARAGLEGAAGRMPHCELAMLRWQAADQASLQRALTIAFEHHELLAAVRKYDDHADSYGYGGFFFWFDMLSRSEAIMAVTEVATRERWRAEQLQIVLDLPEFDGCFVDSHELGRGYGTAMALLCLSALDG